MTCMGLSDGTFTSWMEALTRHVDDIDTRGIEIREELQELNGYARRIASALERLAPVTAAPAMVNKTNPVSEGD